MPIPTFENTAPAGEDHPIPSQTPAQALGPQERSRLHRIYRQADYPQELLNQLNEAQNQANQQDPEQDQDQDLGDAVYIMTHSSVRESTEPTFLVESVLTTLEKANTTAMNFFRANYWDYFPDREGDDRSNFFWLGDEDIPRYNRVGWCVDSCGELTLVAFDSEGDRYAVEVHSRFLV